MGDPSQFAAEVACPRPENGDFYSPFFRVKFFASLATTRDVELTPSQLRRENRISPNAARLANQPPVTGQEFLDIKVNEENAAFSYQNLLDSRELQNYASEMSIEYEGSSVARITLTLTPPYDDAKRILDDRVIQVGTIALVEFGYASQEQNDILSGPYLFELNNPTCSFGDEISISLEGQDVLSANLMRRETKRIWNRGSTAPTEEGVSGGSFPSDLLIVQSLSSQLSLDLNTSLLSSASSLRETKSNALEQSLDDWQFLQILLKDNKCAFLLCGKTLHIYDRNEVVVRERPRYRLLYRSALENPFDVPIINVNFDTKMDLFAGRKAKNITVIAPDRDNGGVSEKEVASDKTGVASIGENVYSGNKGNDKVTATPQGPVVSNKAMASNQTGTILSGSKEDEYLEGRAESLAEEGAFHSGIQGTVTIPGIPAIRPDQKVIIDGLPDYFRGEYLVTKVTHTISDGGFLSELSVTRQGFIRPQAGTKKSPDSVEQSDVSNSVEMPRLIDRRNG